MGAKVLAMGRNLSILQHLQALSSRVSIVQITNDPSTDIAALQKHAPIDAFFDISPPEAAESTHIKSGILALRHGGRISLMGGIAGDIAVPHSAIMHRDLTLKGKWMYSRSDVRDLIKLVEVGLLELGERTGQSVSKFSLEEWEKAFKAAKEYSGTEKSAVIIP